MVQTPSGGIIHLCIAEEKGSLRYDSLMASRLLPLLLLGAGFLQAQKVEADFNESVDFSAFKTYSWRKTKAAENAAR